MTFQRETRVELGHGNDEGFQRIGAARSDRLQGLHDRRADHDRVEGSMRQGRMATASIDGDRKFVGGGHRGAVTHSESADRHAGQIVHAEDARDGEALEEAVVDHRLAAGAALFGRLEDQRHRALEGARVSHRLRAAPSSIAMCPSWPQACIAPGVRDA